MTNLASAQNNPRAIAVDATTVYWVNMGSVDSSGRPSGNGSVMKCAIDGCGDKPIVLASNQLNPIAIAVDATSVYWVNRGTQNTQGGYNGDGSVMKCAIGGCGGMPTVLAAGQYGSNTLAVDATAVYWTNEGDGTPSTGTLVKCAVGGCGGTPTILATKQLNPLAVATDGMNVFWSTQVDQSVVTCPVDGCVGAPTVLASNQVNPTSLAVDATSVYWTNTISAQSVMKCAKAGCGDSPTRLTQQTTSPSNIVVNGPNVYWTSVLYSTDGTCTTAPCDSPYKGLTVSRCPLDGCGFTPTILVSIRRPGASPSALSVGATAVFWGQSTPDWGPVTPNPTGMVSKLAPR